MECPRCSVTLQKSSYCNIIVFYCPHCHGVAVTVSGLRSLGVDPENIYNIWASANAGKRGCELSCPECDNPMRLIKIDNLGTTFYVDVCIRCQLIWFDSGELEKIPVTTSAGIDTLPPQVKEIAAICNMRQLESETPAAALPDHLWCFRALKLLFQLIFN